MNCKIKNLIWVIVEILESYKKMYMLEYFDLFCIFLQQYNFFQSFQQLLKPE